MKGQRLGMLSLRLDALYCLVLGAAVAVASSAISSALALPTGVILAIGISVVLWAGFVEWIRRTLDLRLALRIVMIANIAATLAVALVSFTAAAFFAVLGVLAVSVDIALFAGSQAFALGRLRVDTS
ncbi:hypothetical protein [Cumulibacter soli]|uniref:hypothetical protein n=1 Tax=Cumulibacter soli TaxID=2546344 RepID=UPI001067517E|nr:hypothetical protein [Cumulibacter soli]